jgi:hypothetical protein
MMQLLHDLAVFFGSERYSQHSICLTSDPLMLILYTSANLTIGLAYISIGGSLLTKRHVIADLNPPALALYGTFILLCACTHFSGVLVLFTGVYRLDVAILAATAAVSAITAFYTVVAVWGHSDH